MRRFFCLLAMALVLFSLTACNAGHNEPDAENELSANHMSTSCSKDGVEEFMSIIGEVELGFLSTGMKLDEEHCYNVTPLSVASETDIKIFKFSDSCVSLALIDNEVYEICTSFGGYGFVNAVPWDYDV